MKHSLFSLFLITLSISLHAQTNSGVHIQNISPKVGWGDKSLYLEVLDSLSGTPMYGATVQLISKNNTISVVYNKEHTCLLNPKLADSIIVEARFLGYNVLRTKVKIDLPAKMTIVLSQRKTEIAEIVVKGKTLAYVIDNDTVKFNAASVKTMDGSTLADLLSRFPGVSVTKSGFTFNGRVVEKLYIDKEKLFGDNVGLAISNLMADDIVDIKVYEELEEFDKVNKVKHPKKILVANVKTKNKNKLKYVRQANMELMPIAYYPSNSKYRAVNSFNHLVSSTVGKTIYADVSGRKIEHEEDNASSFNGRISFNKSKSLDYGLASSLQFNFNDKGKHESVNKIFNNLTNNEYQQEIVNNQYYKNRNINFKQNYNKWFADKSQNSVKFTIDENNVYQKDNETNTFSDLSLLANSFKNRRSQRKEQIHLYITDTYQKYFEKYDIRLNNYLMFGVEGYDDTHYQSDSLFVNNAVSVLNGDGDYNNSHFNETFSLYKDIGHFTLHFCDDFQYSKLKRDISYIDLKSKLDSTQTKDFRGETYNNIVYLGFTYYYMGWNISTGVSNNYMIDKVLDYFPLRLSNSREYNRFEYDFSINKSVGAVSYFKMDVETKRGDLPSDNIKGANLFLNNTMNIEKLRDNLVEITPLNYMVGTPDLKEPLETSLNLNYSLATNSYGMFNFTIAGKRTADYVGHRIEHFTKDTLLEKYNYTIKAGSTITKYENLGTYRSLSCQLNYSTFINPIKSKLELNSSIVTSKMPIALNGDRIYNNGLEYRFNANYVSGFSKYFELTLSSSISSKRNEINTSIIKTNVFYNYMQLKFDLFKRLRFSTEFRGTLYDANMDLEANRFEPQLHAYIRYSITKNNLYVFFHASDLLNSIKPINITIFDNYLETRSNRQTGRCFFVSLKWSPKW